MVYFRKVRWKNLLSTGNSWTEIILDKSPNTLIIGENGSGKSTVLDALVFSLFGVAFRNVNNPNLVNSINDRDLLVELEFRIGSKEYLIRRGLKPGIFEIFDCGIKLNQDSSSRDYQKHLETNILRFNRKSFMQIVVLGSALFVPFMQLKPDVRRLVLDDLLDIQILSSMNKIVGMKISDLKLLVSDVKKNIENVISQIELQKKYIQDSKNNNQARLLEFEKEYSQIVEEIDGKQTQVKINMKFIDTLLVSINDYDSITTELRTLHELESKIDNNKKKILKVVNFFNANSSCPTCEQDIKAEFKETKIEAHNRKIKEFEDAVALLITKQDKLNTRQTEINEIQKQIRGYQIETSTLNASIVEISKYANKILTNINTHNSKTILSDEMMKISEDLVNKLDDLNNQQKINIDNRQYLDAAGVLLKDDGIKQKIVKQYLPVINTLVNKYLGEMNFFVQFELDGEFREIIRSRHRDVFSYENFSEGEKTRIDLSLMFAWRAVAKLKNSVSTNLLILDEVLDGSLDNSGIDDIMKLINSFRNETNIFVISHKDLFVDKFDSIIKFEKVGNFSRVV